MGWITLAAAQEAVGTTANTNEAANLIATWLQDVCARTPISRTYPVITVYSRDGIALKQERAVTVVEYRGLDKTLAKFLAHYLEEDNTCQWTMYGIDQMGGIHEAEVTYGPPSTTYADTLFYWIGGSGTRKQVDAIHSKLGRYFYPPTSGTSVHADAQRANASDGWMVRTTSTSYAAPSYAALQRTINMAFIPFPPNEAWVGVVVSESGQKTMIADGVHAPVFQSVKTVTREYRYLSLAQASDKVTSETETNSRTFEVQVMVVQSTGGNVYRTVTVRGGGSDGGTAATDKVATSRPQANGLYTVSVNEITYQVTTS